MVCLNYGNTRGGGAMESVGLTFKIRLFNGIKQYHYHWFHFFVIDVSILF